MERLIADIVEAVRRKGVLDGRALDAIVSKHNRRFRDPVKHFAKKQIASAYRNIKRNDPALWKSWGLDDATERALMATVQMKPRRTASGVATITVITKPHPCSGDCLYCPSDVRMPKSYLHDEPACQRAERNAFDPYLQVASRLTSLVRMGHATDKIELIVLGGSFTDYPYAYQTWFVREMFRALNDAGKGIEGVGDVFAADAGPGDATPLARGVRDRMLEYRTLFGTSASDTGAENPFPHRAHLDACASWQERVESNDVAYNDAVMALYGPGSTWDKAAAWQSATLQELENTHAANEDAAHRVVGLVVETRPDTVDTGCLTLLRRLGCTKIQMGVQTLDEQVSERCNRPCARDRLAEAFELARAFGFKSHAHFMANLPGATLEGDAHDYRSFVNDEAIAPDEVKLYPCVLIESSRLNDAYVEGSWKPYEESDLVELLAQNVVATPEHTRISRMIRDFSSGDIVAGNKKTNLRQMVENHVSDLVAGGAPPVREIRMREVATSNVDAANLHLETHTYRTSNSTEHFLQWVSEPEAGSAVCNHIAGFLRLSLPDRSWIERHAADVPVAPGQAMIREVHVYGVAARLGEPTSGAQHQGLGRAMIERACEIAHKAGYACINVISAVGTRAYYRNLGFQDTGLYLQRGLE